MWIYALISAGCQFGVVVLVSCPSGLQKPPVRPPAEAPEELAPWDRWLLRAEQVLGPVALDKP